jgi:hypothetical protein
VVLVVVDYIILLVALEMLVDILHQKEIAVVLDIMVQHNIVAVVVAVLDHLA